MPKNIWPTKFSVFNEWEPSVLLLFTITTIMMTKGQRWSDAEVWADTHIQKHLDKTHKNSENFRKTQDYRLGHGY